MKHLKTYENVNNNESQVGDYVLCKPNNMDVLFGTKNQKTNLKNFIQNNIGIIKKITADEIQVKYHDVPFTINKFFNYDNTLSFELDEIIISSSDIEDIKKEYELRFTSNKYNL